MRIKKVYNMNEKKYKRIFTVVIDSLGAGEMPDASSYGADIVSGYPERAGRYAD